MLTKKQKIIKRNFDIILAIFGVVVLGWLILVLVIISSFDTKDTGILVQERIGLQKKKFLIYKIRTMKKPPEKEQSHFFLNNKFRVTLVGSVLRKFKLDELPQLINVLKGDMSFVGPRPDVSGFADELTENDSIILSVRPGITGPASIFFREEEKILLKQKFPEEYNRNVIWKKKIELNKEYVKTYSFAKDIGFILKTLKTIV